jgi:hypothetical protein
MKVVEINCLRDGDKLYPVPGRVLSYGYNIRNVEYFIIQRVKGWSYTNKASLAVTAYYNDGSSSYMTIYSDAVQSAPSLVDSYEIF